MNALALEGGFADEPGDTARTFRACLRALARPGTIEHVHGVSTPGPLSVAAGAVLLTLCDTETPVFLAGAHDVPVVREWITFHTGAPKASDRAQAAFAVGNWDDLLPLDAYPAGTQDYPDRSATLIVETDSNALTRARLTGPGMRQSKVMLLPELQAFQANHAIFPQGLDFFFAAGDSLTALPRSTKPEPI